MFSQYVAFVMLALINVETIVNADYVIEDTFEGESYKIYGPPTIPKQFTATLETVAHQSDKVSTPPPPHTHIHKSHICITNNNSLIDTTTTTTE